MKYLHSNGIAHCDIKLNNILLDEYYSPKLCDFNLSKDVNVTNDVTCGGTIPYSAPETLKEGAVVDFFKADIWSFTITVYEISEAVLPFNKDQDGNWDTDHFIIEMDNKELKEMIEKCTLKNPLERIGADQILQESYFTKMKEEDYYCDYDNDENQSYYDDNDEYAYFDYSMKGKKHKYYDYY